MVAVGASLERLQEIVSDSVGARGGADIHLSPDGRFLYSTNRLKAEGIAIFSVDGETGLLTDTHRDIPVSRAVCVQF